MTKKKIVLIIMTILIVTVGIGVKVKINKEIEMRNQVTQELQEKVTEYIVENYEGITKIEWLGWKKTPMGTSTNMIINDYPAEFMSDFFYFNLKDEFDERNYEQVDSLVSATTKNSPMQDTLRKQNVQKNEHGSSEVEVIHNWKENKIKGWK